MEHDHSFIHVFVFTQHAPCNTCGNAPMFVGWVVTYQAAARVISRPKVSVYLSHFRTCNHVLLLLQ